jgi:hypothetical protein
MCLGKYGRIILKLTGSGSKGEDSFAVLYRLYNHCYANYRQRKEMI